MVVRRRRKVRKFRGKRSYGRGSHKKARGAGSRGGRGRAGMHKHKWTYTVKYAPEHFGKKGFKPPIERFRRCIDLEELDQLVRRLAKQGKLESVEGKFKISLREFGYDKLLGRGRIGMPVIVEAKEFSEQAVKKVLEAGGEVRKA